MNDLERKQFWETLIQAKNENDGERLKNSLKYPSKLYRYRSVSKNVLDSLKINRLFFSTSNYYDDPFDTYIRIDFERVRNIDKEIGEDDYALQETYSLLKEVRKIMRERTWSICFSESYLNESLWLKYAANHTGFVLEYSTEDIARANFNVYSPVKCNPLKNCANIPMRNELLPMYYSDDPYDATEYARFMGKCYLLEKTGDMEGIKRLLDSGAFQWEPERIMTIKKKIHHFDQEWRLVLSIQPNVVPGITPYKECIPSKIILGLNMSEDDEMLVVKKAQQAGINIIERAVIDETDELNTVRLQ